MAAVGYRCRKCRFVLFTTKDLSDTHTQKDQCPSWYLREDEEMLPWVHDLINESGWTEGKLYCPKCNSRIGGFDFLHVVQCACLENIIPAIWCPKSRVDNIVNLENRNAAMRGISKNEDTGQNVDQGVSSSNIENGSSTTTDHTAQQKGNSPDDMDSVFGTNKCCKFTLGSGADCKELKSRSKDHFVENSSEKIKHPSLESYPDETVDPTDSLYFTQRAERQMSPKRDKGSFQYGNRKHGMKTNSCLKDVCNHCCHCSSKHQEGQDNSDEMFYATANTCCETVTCIHESIKEIRREMVDLYNLRSSESCLAGNCKKNRRKIRRRGRGKWQFEHDYLAALKNAKKESEVIENSTAFIDMSSSKAKNIESIEKELSDSEIPDCYKCAVCLSLLHEPQKTPCLHVFCGICLKQLNHVSRGRPKCPLCREPVRYVTAEEVMETELQVSFPVNYRKRVKEARKNRHKNAALPSPQSTMFDTVEEYENHQPTNQLVHHLSVIAIIISIVINSLLMNAHGNPLARVDLQRKLAMLLLIILGCMMGALIFLFLIVYAFDFVKISFLLVLSYFALTKLALNAFIDE